jgi:hypothetical protein
MTYEEMIARMSERCELAAIYAEDGAFFHAAEILDELGAEVKRFAKELHRMPARMRER